MLEVPKLDRSELILRQTHFVPFFSSILRLAPKRTALGDSGNHMSPAAPPFSERFVACLASKVTTSFIIWVWK